MIVKNNNPSFGLKIKNLTIDDVNCKYTCACGLQQYTKMLDLLTVKYICKLFKIIFKDLGYHNLDKYENYRKHK